jgi:hypothetical protein
MSRYFHSFPRAYKKRPNYTALFTEEDKAKMEYNKNMSFRRFVAEWNADAPELLGWSLLDFYKAFKKGGVQIAFSF